MSNLIAFFGILAELKEKSNKEVPRHPAFSLSEPREGQRE